MEAKPDKNAKNVVALTYPGLETKLLIAPCKVDFKKEAGLFVPFNFIKHAPEGEAGNMELTTRKRDGNTIPLYRNKRLLDRGDELLLDSVSRMLDSASGKKAKKSSA